MTDTLDTLLSQKPIPWDVVADYLEENGDHRGPLLRLASRNAERRMLVRPISKVWITQTHEHIPVCKMLDRHLFFSFRLVWERGYWRQGLKVRLKIELAKRFPGLNPFGDDDEFLRLAAGYVFPAKAGVLK